jgi:TRAP-type transport system periplasmic protein
MRILAILLVMLAAACTKPVDPNVTELVYATPYSPNHPFSRADTTWMKFVEKRSGGTLKIKTSWSGALLSSDQSMTELRHGVADIGLITPIYAKGGSHLIRVQSGFYSGAKTVENQVALYRCMATGNPQFARELEGLEVLAVQGGSLPGIITREKPVKTLADLRGMRIRAPTELLSVLKHLGADPVNMPMGEVYSALAKGVLDGVIAPSDTFKAMHFAEVSRYYTTLEVPRGAYPARAMGSRRWAKLSPEHQQVLRDGIAIWEAALADETRTALVQGIDVAVKEGVKVRPIARVEQHQFDALYLRDAEANAAKLKNYGIDGAAVFATARSSVSADGEINCKGTI